MAAIGRFRSLRPDRERMAGLGWKADASLRSVPLIAKLHRDRRKQQQAQNTAHDTHDHTETGAAPSSGL